MTHPLPQKSHSAAKALYEDELKEMRDAHERQVTALRSELDVRATKPRSLPSTSGPDLGCHGPSSDKLHLSVV
jgi:hypothetical protein